MTTITRRIHLEVYKVIYFSCPMLTEIDQCLGEIESLSQRGFAKA